MASEGTFHVQIWRLKYEMKAKKKRRRSLKMQLRGRKATSRHVIIQMWSAGKFVRKYVFFLFLFLHGCQSKIWILEICISFSGGKLIFLPCLGHFSPLLAWQWHRASCQESMSTNPSLFPSRSGRKVTNVFSSHFPQLVELQGWCHHQSVMTPNISDTKTA